MKFQFSAGGVVYKKENGKLWILVSQHSQHHGWVFPKGLIGDHIDGEKKEDTAVREVEEETGMKAKIIEELAPVTYWFVLNNEKIKKTVYYFLMEFIKDTGKRDTEMEAVEWLLIDKVTARLTYKSDKQVFEQALPILSQLTN